MSETAGGPGWWQASDGRYYPPESHPDPGYRAQYAAAQAPPTAPTYGAPAYGAPASPAPTYAAPSYGAPGAQISAAPGGYPVGFDADPPRKIARWRALVHLFMAIPHQFVLAIFGYALAAGLIVSWFSIVFTGRQPAWAAKFTMQYLRYQNRIMTFSLLLHDQWPDFELPGEPADPQNNPARTWFRPKLDGRNRLTTFFRYFMLIPHAIALYLLMIGGLCAYLVGWFAVLFTGRMPEGIANFLVGIGRWITRVAAYGYLFTDEYPPFSLS
jgi:hypothetical protein